MPDTGDPPADDTPDPVRAEHRERVQEREVRLTAQRLLTEHLHPGNRPNQPATTFWVNIDLDLTGAILIDLNLSCCTVRNVQFDKAELAGYTQFDGAKFAGTASFDKAKFANSASFDKAELPGTRYAGPDTPTPWTDFAEVRFVRGCHRR